MRQRSRGGFARVVQTLGGALGAALLCLLVLVPGIGTTALTDPDEGRQAEVAREVFAAGDLGARVVPQLDGVPYHHKPVLFYWLVDAAYAVNGVASTSARLVPVLAGTLLVVLLHLWTASTAGLAAARWAALAFATSLGGALLARFVNLDMTLTLFVTAGAMAAERWSARAGHAGWLAAAGAAAALGFLTKGLEAPLFVGAVAGTAWFLARPPLRLCALGGALAAFLVIVSPWLVEAWRADPTYLAEFFVRHHFGRFAGEHAPHPHGLLFYVPVVLVGLFPWTAIVPGALVRLRAGRADRAAVLCLVWAAIVIVFFSLSRGKLVTYVLPALPPLCVLVGRYAAGLWASGPRSDRERRALVLGAAAAAVVLCAAPLAIPAVVRAFGDAFRAAALPVLLLVPFGIGLGVLARCGALRALPGALAAGMVVALVAYHGWSAPRIGDVASTAELARSLEPVGEGDQAQVVAYNAHAHSLGFYLGRPVPRLVRPRELRHLADAGEDVFVVTKRSLGAEVELAGVPYLWADTGRWVLYGTRPPASEAAAPDEPRTVRIDRGHRVL